MDNQTIFLALIAVFVAVSAAALIFQAAMLYGTYKASRELRDRIVPLTVKVDALVDTSRKTIDEARIKMGEITNKTNEILDVAKQQMDIVSEVVEEASVRTRRQLKNAEIVVEDALVRAQQTVATGAQGNPDAHPRNQRRRRWSSRGAAVPHARHAPQPGPSHRRRGNVHLAYPMSPVDLPLGKRRHLLVFAPLLACES